jgi:hypothetical protein
MTMAIRLFFEERDSISTYTLAAATQELLRGLLKARGQGSRLKDSDLIVPGRESEWRRALNKPQNFFKHSDRDPDEVLEFRPDTLVPFTLLDCIDMYGRYVRKSTKGGVLFFAWFSLSHRDLLLPGTEIAKLAEEFHRENPCITRKDLFLEVLNMEEPAE